MGWRACLSACCCPRLLPVLAQPTESCAGFSFAATVALQLDAGALACTGKPGPQQLTRQALSAERCACRYLLFPRLRAVADLLMMPKEVLTDRLIRAEVVPGLSLRIICALLGRFHPDDFAAEPLPPGVERCFMLIRPCPLPVFQPGRLTQRAGLAQSAPGALHNASAMRLQHQRGSTPCTVLTACSGA